VKAEFHGEKRIENQTGDSNGRKVYARPTNIPIVYIVYIYPGIFDDSFSHQAGCRGDEFTTRGKEEDKGSFRRILTL
jgi:hypothetical protein